jgi:hypothetical protein
VYYLIVRVEANEQTILFNTLCPIRGTAFQNKLKRSFLSKGTFFLFFMVIALFIKFRTSRVALLTGTLLLLLLVLLLQVPKKRNAAHLLIVVVLVCCYCSADASIDSS